MNVCTKIHGSPSIRCWDMSYLDWIHISPPAWYLLFLYCSLGKPLQVALVTAYKPFKMGALFGKRYQKLQALSLCCCFLSDDDCWGRCLHQSLWEGMRRLSYNTPALCLMCGLHLLALFSSSSSSQPVGCQIRSDLARTVHCVETALSLHECMLEQ